MWMLATASIKIEWLEVHRKCHNQRDGKVDQSKPNHYREVWTFYQLFFKPYCQLSKSSFLIVSCMISNVFHDSWEKHWFITLASILLAVHAGRGLTITSGTISQLGMASKKGCMPFQTPISVCGDLSFLSNRNKLLNNTNNSFKKTPPGSCMHLHTFTMHFPRYQIIQSHNYRMVWIERNLRHDLVPSCLP